MALARLSFWLPVIHITIAIIVLFLLLADELSLNSAYSLLLPQIASSAAAKKLWEKGGDVKLPSGNNGPLPPLQLHGGPDNQVWRDSTWSTQGELMTPRRSFPVDSNSGGILRYVRRWLATKPTTKQIPE